MDFNKEQYFKRQTSLPEIGKKGQELLQNAKVLIIGCGGLGNPVAIYLATSGVGELHLVDFDTVSISNLHRQVFYKMEDIGKAKTKVLANEIKKRTPFTKVAFTNKAIDKDSIIDLILKYDIVVDGTDSLPIKYLINDACVLAKKPLVYGSLYKFDGYVATFNILGENSEYTCNLRDAFPKIATDIPNCEEAGTLNPIVGLIALFQANEVIKLITKKGKLLINQLLIYNSLQNTQFKIKLKKNKKLNIEEVFKNSAYLDANCTLQDSTLLITAAELKKNISDSAIEIVSILTNFDDTIPFSVHQKIPYKTFDIDNFKPNFKKKYVIICARGITSYAVTLKIKEKYPLLSVLSLSGGITKY
ncbi:HesA/MoeB/ThiF family protein [Lutibacter sp.]|uniref:HesA/MoeB/ThiF family protein n=1 Tax=Lutibacter sp. TaxID=1925666 RepID=UPI0025C11025|nr:HesA/MoeB/ThiF family protein [Lutibacter sp.]MCF6167733.1 HesA/MoeB/ThiF family protein [Lutibacter sp.]